PAAVAGLFGALAEFLAEFPASRSRSRLDHEYFLWKQQTAATSSASSSNGSRRLRHPTRSRRTKQAAYSHSVEVTCSTWSPTDSSRSSDPVPNSCSADRASMSYAHKHLRAMFCPRVLCVLVDRQASGTNRSLRISQGI